jgi:hypothetical protein
MSCDPMIWRLRMWVCEHVFGWEGSPSLHALGLHTTLRWVRTGRMSDAGTFERCHVAGCRVCGRRS